MWGEAGLAGVFTAAFLAATPVPFQSELIFLAAQAAQIAPLWVLIAVASVGNTLGSVVTYALGREIAHWQDRSWFPVTPAHLERAAGWYRRWGLWTLLFSWAPFGDAIVLISGVLRTPWPTFVLMVAVAKTGRYIVLAGVAGLFI